MFNLITEERGVCHLAAVIVILAQRLEWGLCLL